VEMTPNDFAILREQVKQDEGLALKPYTDTVGKLTIGYGRNLTDNGINSAEASAMLDHDLETAIAALTQAHPDVLALDPVRQIVLGNMAYNMGVPRVSGFTKMWAAIAVRDFATAALEMIESTWAEQVGARATRLAEAMRSGELKA
jgi:lysozyme